MKRALLFVVMLVLILAIFRLTSGGHSPPPMFAEALTLDQAIDRAGHSGKLVLAMATADWCPPCRQMKAGTLIDPDVERLVKERFEPVYMDISGPSSPGVADASRFSIKGVPTFIVLDAQGSVAAQVSGGMDAPAFIDFLRSAGG